MSLKRPAEGSTFQMKYRETSVFRIKSRSVGAGRDFHFWVRSSCFLSVKFIYRRAVL